MMKKSIYIQLVLIFLVIFFLSNIAASILVSINVEQDLVSQMRDQLTRDTLYKGFKTISFRP